MDFWELQNSFVWEIHVGFARVWELFGYLLPEIIIRSEWSLSLFRFLFSKCCLARAFQLNLSSVCLSCRDSFLSVTLLGLTASQGLPSPPPPRSSFTRYYAFTLRPSSCIPPGCSGFHFRFLFHLHALGLLWYFVASWALQFGHLFPVAICGFWSRPLLWPLTCCQASINVYSTFHFCILIHVNSIHPSLVYTCIWQPFIVHIHLWLLIHKMDLFLCLNNLLSQLLLTHIWQEQLNKLLCQGLYSCMACHLQILSTCWGMESQFAFWWQLDITEFELTRVISSEFAHIIIAFTEGYVIYNWKVHALYRWSVSVIQSGEWTCVLSRNFMWMLLIMLGHSPYSCFV